MGWTAVLGPLLTLGVLSMVHLTPQAFAVARGEPGTVSEHVAYGFGAYVPEATLLLIMPTVLWAAPYLGPSARRFFGAPVWMSVAVPILFVPGAVGFQATWVALMPSVNGSEGYFPVLIILALYGIGLARAGHAAAAGFP